MIHRQAPPRRRSRGAGPPISPFLLLAFLLFLFAVLPCPCAAAKTKDPYKILGIGRDADDATIKRAYRKLSLKYHPDKNPGDDSAQQKFVEVAEAHGILSDATKRRQYDRFGTVDENGGGGGGGGQGFDPFGSFFGFGGARGRRQEAEEDRRGPDLTIPLVTSLEALYSGDVIEVAHRKQTICAKWSDCEVKCKKCGGTGVVKETRQIGPGFIQQFQTTCPVCQGSGKIVKDRACKGCPSGQFEKAERGLLIDLEKGMKDGDTIVFDGEADEHPDLPAGNLIFTVRPLPHETFIRDGNNLKMKMNISLAEALLGIEREVRQLDGRMVKVVKKDVTRPHDKLTIAGEGMPMHAVSGSGNLVIEFWVEFPDTVADSHSDAIRKILGNPPRFPEGGVAAEEEETGEQPKEEL